MATLRTLLPMALILEAAAERVEVCREDFTSWSFLSWALRRSVADAATRADRALATANPSAESSGSAAVNTAGLACWWRKRRDWWAEACFVVHCAPPVALAAEVSLLWAERAECAHALIAGLILENRHLATTATSALIAVLRLRVALRKDPEL